MFGGLGMPIPYLSNKPGPGRPGWGPAGTYDFQFEVTGAVTIKANAAAAGDFRISWPNGTTQVLSGNNTSIAAPDGTAGIVSINNEKLDTTYADEFAVVGNKTAVTKVISWGQNPWNNLVAAFDSCTNLTSISETSLITDSTGNLQAIFRDCTGLTEAVCKNWNLSAGSTIADIFEGCTNLTKLDFTGVNIKISSSSARAFKSVGNTTTDGCEFLFSGLNLSTWSYTGNQNFEWFSSTKIKPTSTFANWSFNPSVGPNGMTQLFTNATITGTNSTLDISGWSSYSGNSMSQWFQNFNAWNVVGNTGAKINLTNLGTTNVNSMYFFGWKSGVTELTGLSTLGANTGNTGTIQMESAFRELRFLKLSGSNNFGNTFTSSIKPITFKSTFRDSGAGLTSDYSEAPIFSNMDASSCLTFQNMLQGTKLATMPDFDTVTFPTTAVSFAASFSAITATSYSGSHLDLSNATFKPSTFNSLLSSANIEKVTFGNNVDLSGCTDFTSLALNGGSTAQPMEIILPTDADYSSATSFNTAFQGLDGPSAGNPPLTTCVADTLIRRLFATNLNGALTLNLESSKITEAPSVVQSQLDQLRTAGWNITDNSTDATLPFAYASYAVDPTGITTISPTTTPPAGSVFTATNSLSINSSTGVITIGTFRGGSTITCTYPDGCYNEVVMLIQVPFVMRTKIPAGGSSFTLSPQMSSGECFIDWGDANSETLTQSTTHSYATSGSDQEYDIKLFDSPSGSKFTGFATAFGELEASYEKTILKWGDIEWQNNSWFGTTTTDTYKIRLAAPNGADHKPNLSQVTSLYKMFGTSQPYRTIKLTGWFEDTNDNLEHWDVSTITNMSYMFRNPDPVSTKDDGSDNILKCANWDVSNVQNFEYFMGGHKTSSQVSRNFSVQLNIEMTNWDTSGATDMSYMFWQHEKNKTGIENFRTENVTTLSFFYGGGTWNAKTKMHNSILRWDVSNVEDFSSASIVVGTNEADTNANFPNNWRFSTDASKNLNFEEFCGGEYVRLGAGPYYLTDLEAFAPKTINENWYGGTSYTSWNMTNASSISNFGGSSYRGAPPLGLFRNYNISGWDITSKCTSFNNLWVAIRAVANAPVTFDLDLSGWNVTGITGDQGYFMRGGQYPTLNDVNMSTSNYDATLTGWGALAASVNSGVTVNFGISKYSPGNIFEGSQGTNQYQGNSIYAGGKDMEQFVSVGDVVERPPDPNGIFDTYAIVTGFNSWNGSSYLRATTQGNIGPSTYTVMDSDAAKGRVALINAGWTITDGGADIPFTSTELIIDVNAGDTFTIFSSGSNNNYSVDWGDGNGFSSTPYTGTSATGPAYATGGEKTIKINKDSSEKINALYFYNQIGTINKIKKISNWGTNAWDSLYRAFKCHDTLADRRVHPDFTVESPTPPNFSNGPNISNIFDRCNVNNNIFTNSQVSNWNVRSLNSLYGAFYKCFGFNEDISGWDTSYITSLDYAFGYCSSLNSDISNWDTSRLTTMNVAFSGCSSLNADLNTKDTGSGLAWDVSKVSGFYSALAGTSMSYNIDKWQIKTTGGVSFQSLFNGCNWPNLTLTPKTVTVGSGAYQKTYLAWDTQKVARMDFMIAGNSFNVDIGKWDTSSVTTLDGFAKSNSVFNNGGQPMNARQVTVGTGATARTYTAWDTSNISSWKSVFKSATSFNQDIGNWDLSGATGNVYRILENASSFNHEVNWVLPTGFTPNYAWGWYFFSGTNMSTVNYTNTIVNFANTVYNNSGLYNAPATNMGGGRTFDSNMSGGANFANAWEARSYLTNTVASGGAGWTLSGDTVIPLVIEPTKLKIRVAANSTLDFKFGDVQTGSSFQVVWGDSSTDSTGLGTGIHSHTYSNTTGSSIDYELEYNGGTTTDPCTYVRFDDNGDAASRNAIVEVSHWGSTQFTNLQNMFRNLVNNDVTATDTPNLSNATSLSGMFQSNQSLVNSNGSIGDWDISNINNITFLFNGANNFNVNISKWDTSSCYSFYWLFKNATSFNQDVSTKYVTANDSPTGSAYWAWNTSAVGNIQNAFSNTSSFAPASGSNPGIYNWNTSSIVNMKLAFTSSSYGKPLNTALIQAGSSPTGNSYVAWDVSNVTTFESMFNSSTFNSDISKWKLKSGSGKIVQLKEMFRNNTTFNQDISTKTIAAVDSPYGTQYEAWNIESSDRISEVIRNSGVNQSLNWGVNTSWVTYDIHRWAAQQGGVLSTNNYTDQIVKWANEVNNNSKSPANMYALVGDQGGAIPDFDTTRTYSSGFANAGRARSYLSLDVRVSGATGYNGTYYYNYETERYVNENDSTYEFRFDSEEGWQLFDEGGAQYTGGGTESSGPTSGTWTGVTVIDYSAGWTFDGALII